MATRLSSIQEYEAPEDETARAIFLEEVVVGLEGGFEDRISSLLTILDGAFTNDLRVSEVETLGLADKITETLSRDQASCACGVWALAWIAENYPTVSIATDRVMRWLEIYPNDEIIIRMICWILTYRPDVNSVGLLTGFADRTASTSWQPATRALAALDHPSARAALKRNLRDPDLEVRQATFLYLIQRSLFPASEGSAASHFDLGRWDPNEGITPELLEHLMNQLEGEHMLEANLKQLAQEYELHFH